ncbi:hypothetical protein PTD2_12414 [Pseudoalteromonas tunicata D2]|uniref:Uncharacterized protein n=1 Tax=Pseudoalteromonas tunicata D2 TaxID=87626 RepID=A4C6L7_9GAMM|nr:hypothetical protein PTD2_12414 [Pseudoalteromonas tunicata D2]
MLNSHFFGTITYPAKQKKVVGLIEIKQ